MTHFFCLKCSRARERLSVILNFVFCIFALFNDYHQNINSSVIGIYGKNVFTFDFGVCYNMRWYIARVGKPLCAVTIKLVYYLFMEV